MKPLVIDLCCGLGGWAEGFLAEGWDVIGFDIEGSGDLIGWRIGDGKFISAETKSKTGRLTDEQRNFMAQVLNAGGIAGCVRSIEEFRELMEGL